MSVDLDYFSDAKSVTVRSSHSTTMVLSNNTTSALATLLALVHSDVGGIRQHLPPNYLEDLLDLRTEAFFS